MSSPAFQCASCIHFHTGNRDVVSCNAFPFGIPGEIIWGEVDHRLKHPGDNGIQWSPLPRLEAEDETPIEEENE